MLSLSPRFDLIRFNLPKEFLPNEIENKYKDILAVDPNVFLTPIDYLNESIQSITIPGISDILIEQQQHSYNDIKRNSNRINVEPNHTAHYTSSSNPLANINKEFTVSFRINQGLYNYFMIYETIFYHICKPINNPPYDKMFVDILNETGNPVSRITFMQVYISGIDGLEFSFNKIQRDSETFNVTFNFNNIDFDYKEINK